MGILEDYTFDDVLLKPGFRISCPSEAEIRFCVVFFFFFLIFCFFFFFFFFQPPPPPPPPPPTRPRPPYRPTSSITLNTLLSRPRCDPVTHPVAIVPMAQAWRHLRVPRKFVSNCLQVPGAAGQEVRLRNGLSNPLPSAFRLYGCRGFA